METKQKKPYIPTPVRKTYKHYTDTELKELPKTERKRLCLQEIKTIYQALGPWNIGRAHLSRKYDFDEHTIARWVNHIIANTPRESINTIKIMGESSYKKAMALCERCLADPNMSLKNRLEAVSRANETLKNYTAFLEAYGMKQVTPSEVNMNVEASITTDRILAIAQESVRKDLDSVKDVSEVKKD